MSLSLLAHVSCIALQELRTIEADSASPHLTGSTCPGSIGCLPLGQQALTDSSFFLRASEPGIRPLSTKPLPAFKSASFQQENASDGGDGCHQEGPDMWSRCCIWKMLLSLPSLSFPLLSVSPQWFPWQASRQALGLENGETHLPHPWLGPDLLGPSPELDMPLKTFPRHLPKGSPDLQPR